MFVSNMRIRTISGWTMFIFGLLAVVLGLIGLLQPETTLRLMGVDIVDRSARTEGDFTLMFVTASSMASFNMGVYYLLAALNNLKMFYWWTVPFRMVTFTVFTLAVISGIAPANFLSVAVWELMGALATGGALLYERHRDGVG